MKCSFCLDDLENHIHNFVSDYKATEVNGRPVAICGTCVIFFELQTRKAQQSERPNDTDAALILPA
jgi:hypothetical protein